MARGTAFSQHQEKVERLQREFKKNLAAGGPLRLLYGKSSSNTTRAKGYNRGCPALFYGHFDQIIDVDLERKRIWVEPRVTMEALVRATLPLGLMPQITPEFKGITVGGAIMGAAAESTSHQYGIFHDSCTRLEFLDGKGDLSQATPEKNSELFYGLSGSYGSLALLTSAEISLVPARRSVRLRYHHFNDAHETLRQLQERGGNVPFLDGLLFSPTHGVIIEGELCDEVPNRPSYQWFASQVKEGKGPKTLPLFDYLFRYDQGAFWMGSFLFFLPFLARYLGQGVFKMPSASKGFTPDEIALFKNRGFPSPLMQKLTHPFTNSQTLWRLLHRAEAWIGERFLIQDFCIPLPQSSKFLSKILQGAHTFPIWLCPIKGAATSQPFAPHQGHPFFINFGLYGCPSDATPMEDILKVLEKTTQEMEGRKVLYSLSAYSLNEFWDIYPYDTYSQLREKTFAHQVFHELTDKVL